MTVSKNILQSFIMASMFSIGSAIYAVADEPVKKDPMQFARGAKAWAKTCARCHNMKSAADNSDEIWKTSVSHMRVRANIPGNVARDIEAFLKASNDKK